MSEKRNSVGGNGSACKKRRSITMETKMEIVKKVEAGEKIVNVARAYGMNKSTIHTIVKDKQRLMEHIKRSVPMKSTIISKKRGKVIEEMEKLLCLWLEDQQQRRIPISFRLIQEKAISLFEDIKKKHGESAADETFTASHGWFHRFKARAGLHNININGESASTDAVAATEFLEILANIIRKGNYQPQQIFNIDETGLYWKKMPERTYISMEEKSMPGHKPSKDRLTLLLGGNVSGDCKCKPLLVYHCENPRALKNITKASLPVVWKSNPKVWITRAIFEDWFFHHFVPEMEKYCCRNNLPFKILLLLDNSPGHPAFLDDYHPNIKVVYLPPNTTSLIQPMDMGVISTFKKYYLRRIFRQAVKAMEGDSEVTLKQFWKDYNLYHAIKNINASWCEITTKNMNGVWMNLCPQFVHDLKGFEEEEAAVMDNLLQICNDLELDMHEEDFEHLLESHEKELTNEELMELELKGKEEEAEEEPESEPKRFVAKQMAEGFSLMEKALACFESQDPNSDRFAKVSSAINDAFSCYKIIYEEKKETIQTSLDKFLKRVENIKTEPEEEQVTDDPAPFIFCELVVSPSSSTSSF